MLKLSEDLEKINKLVDECIVEKVLLYSSQINKLEVEVSFLRVELQKSNVKMKEISERLLYLIRKIRDIISDNYDF